VEMGTRTQKGIAVRMNDRQMREHVVHLVRKKITEHGLPDRPTWQETVSALGLPVPKSANIAQDGIWVSANRQVVYSSRLTCLERIEFTIFHEVTHGLIENDGEIVSQLAEYFADEVDKNKEQYALESLCHRGAGEFVMPCARFLPMIQGWNWRAAGIRQVATHFGCSAVAAAFQFTLYHPKSCSMAVCEMGVPPGGRGEVLHVAYMVCNHAERFPMYRYEAVPRHHLVHQSWRDGNDAVEKAQGFYRSSHSWPIDCEVIRIGRRAYAAFFHEGNVTFQHHPDQLSMF
jgi:Zn-dependent peptidase ImmA (M78 family)